MLVIVISTISLYQKGIVKNSIPEEKSPEVNEHEKVQHGWMKIQNDQNVEELFQIFLENSLQLIKQVLVTNSVVLLFTNYAKKNSPYGIAFRKIPKNFSRKIVLIFQKGYPAWFCATGRH